MLLLVVVVVVTAVMGHGTQHRGPEQGIPVPFS
jgi:hypothetical protein